VGNGTQRYGLSAYSFLVSKDQTDGIYDRRWVRSGDTARRSTRDYAITADGATITLETQQTYGTSETFEVAAFAPASQVVYDGSAWSFLSTGPTLGTHQLNVRRRWALTIGMAVALDYCLWLNERDRRITDEERTARQREYTRRLDERWGPAAREIIQRRLPRRDPDPPREIVASTAGRGRRWP
jgi:hypothetical protein